MGRRAKIMDRIRYNIKIRDFHEEHAFWWYINMPSLQAKVKLETITRMFYNQKLLRHRILKITINYKPIWEIFWHNTESNIIIN